MTHPEDISAMEEEASGNEEQEVSSQEEPEETLEDVKSMKMMKASKHHREQSTTASYLNVVKEMNALNKDASKLLLKEVPVTVLAEVRHCVQLLGHINEVYRASAFPLLQAYMMRYPVLLPCVVNNIFFIYANPKNKFQKQAKLMGIGCILRCDAATNNKPLLRKLVSEILQLRNPSDRDDVEIFFLVSALQSDAAVQPVSEIILEGMGEELQCSIKELKPSLLWLRVVLAQRMLVTGLKLPVWLKDTFNPDRVVKFGPIIMPKSQKLEVHHPMFENFIPTLASFNSTLEKLKKKKSSKFGKPSKPSAVSILFREEISPAIEKCFGEKRKKPTLEIAYKLLQSVLSCKDVELSVMESVVQWLGGGGLRCIEQDMRGLVVQSLLARLSSLDSLDSEEERSSLAVVVLQGAVVFPEIMKHATKHFSHLTASAAQACVDDLLRAFWRKLTEVEASVLLRLAALRQCSGKDHLEWRLKVTQSMTRKALQSASDEDAQANDGGAAPSTDKENVPDAGAVHVNNRDLFFRFLNHCSHDKSTVCDVLIEAHRVAVKEVKDNPEALPAELHELWQRLAEQVERLQKPQYQQFAYIKLFQVLFSQFALELLKKSPTESEDLLSDLETCLEKALAEEQKRKDADVSASTGAGPCPQEDDDWVLVLVDVLLALGTREDSWWRAVLQPAGRHLSRRMTPHCVASIMDVLLNDDVLQSDEEEEEEEGDHEEMEHNGAEGNGEDVDEREEKEDKGNQEEEEEEDSDDDTEGEDSDSDESDCGDESDSEDESDGGSDGERNPRLKAIKSALFAAMKPAPNSTAVSAELTEDMDAVPIEELRLMDKKMAMVLGAYINKPKARKEKLSLKGDGAQRLHYRNRALDIVEGLVAGPPLPSVLLGSILLPLLRALEVHRGQLMMPLANRIREVLKEVRTVKKYDESEAVNEAQLVDYLEEVFSLAGKVPECWYGVVILLRYSLSLPVQDTASNPVMDAYIKHVRDMLQSRKIIKNVVVEPLNLDMPSLRTQLINMIVAWASPTTATTTNNSTDTSSPSEAETPNEGGVSKSQMYFAWDLLKDVLTKCLTAACTELSEQETSDLASLGRNIEQYFNATQEPVNKMLEPISLIVKLIRKHPASRVCIDWLSLGTALRAFRSRVAPKLVGMKNLKRDVDRLATIVLQPEDGHSAVIDEEKRNLKRKRKELKIEKKQSKKPKISPEDQQNSSDSKALANDKKNNNNKNNKQQKNKTDAPKAKSVDDLFEAEEVFLDANDVDSDQEKSDDGHGTDDKTKEERLSKTQSAKEKKKARTKARKVRAKTNHKVKKQLAKEKKQRRQAERELAAAQGSTEGNTAKENAAAVANGGGDEKSLQERRPKQQPKANKKADDALDAGLQVGIFSTASLAE